MCVLLMYIVSLFFFFKQKTAYEMRISDWSSDVCSSDLVARGADAAGAFGGVGPGGGHSLSFSAAGSPRRDTCRVGDRRVSAARRGILSDARRRCTALRSEERRVGEG